MDPFRHVWMYQHRHQQQIPHTNKGLLLSTRTSNRQIHWSKGTSKGSCRFSIWLHSREWSTVLWAPCWLCQQTEVRFYSLQAYTFFWQTYTRYVHVKPNKFRVGDIVEAQVSCVAFPMRGGQSRLRLVLRALTLLDGTYTKVSYKFNWQSNVDECNI